MTQNYQLVYHVAENVEIIGILTYPKIPNVILFMILKCVFIWASREESYYRVTISFLNNPKLAEAPYPIMIGLDHWIKKRCYIWFVTKHVATLDKNTRELMFYDIISLARSLACHDISLTLAETIACFRLSGHNIFWINCTLKSYNTIILNQYLDNKIISVNSKTHTQIQKVNFPKKNSLKR